MSQAQVIASDLEATTLGARPLQKSLNEAWASARSARTERSALRQSTAATSTQGRARLQELDAEVRVRALQIQRLRGSKAHFTAQTRELRSQQKAIQAAIVKRAEDDLPALAARQVQVPRWGR